MQNGFRSILGSFFGSADPEHIRVDETRNLQNEGWHALFRGCKVLDFRFNHLSKVAYLGICLRKFCLVAFDAQLGYLNLMVSLQSEYYHPWTSQIDQSLRGTTGQMATYLVSRSL